jgi:phosphoribosylglycinamide formyltransferase-1
VRVEGPRRLAVLCSGTGTLLEAIIEAGLGVTVVVTDRECRSEEVAARAGVPVERLERSSFSSAFDREGYSADLAALLGRYEVDLVAMAGFGTVLGASFLDAFKGQVVNTHPALLPAFKGWHAVEAALEAGVAETGCTIHIVTIEVDEGPILAQEAVAIIPGDTVESLHERIKRVERRLYPLTLRRLLESAESIAPTESELP